ncbi:hypothetical protein CCM_08614 [Cordyceps militaris CM01]|uniref:Uncharacterized protein n=1 Tax=Cordyceps militaris (strain CM01) TaxID=983644 RepID=G3JRG6_CORMM|nr:uncharacterized protein CCM_08614 [Cordyceps militaris CM01]EGX88569.1 hypothetical protein CCM_08614 [Cordyceps militaris CM01]
MINKDVARVKAANFNSSPFTMSKHNNDCPFLHCNMAENILYNVWWRVTDMGNYTIQLQPVQPSKERSGKLLQLIEHPTRWVCYKGYDSTKMPEFMGKGVSRGYMRAFGADKSNNVEKLWMCCWKNDRLRGRAWVDRVLRDLGTELMDDGLHAVV